MPDAGRGHALIPLALLGFALLSGAACGGGSGQEPTDAVYQQYFAKLSPAVTALHQRIPALDVSGDAEPSSLAQTLRSYDETLKGFAADLDKIDAPGKAHAPHKSFAKTSRDIAKTFDKLAERLSKPSHTPTSDELKVAVSGSGAVVQWVGACERLQDLGSERGMTLDFKCPTTLGLGSVEGN